VVQPQCDSASSFFSLADQLRSENPSLRAFLRNTVSVFTADPVLQNNPLSTEVSSLCAGAQILGLEAPQHSQTVTLKVKTPADCPLTVSMNYVEILRADGENDRGEHEELRVFPAYGALTGIWVKQGTTAIHIDAHVTIPLIIHLLKWAGCFLFFLILFPRVRLLWKNVKRIAFPLHT
jgi:hypothetical protein